MAARTNCENKGLRMEDGAIDQSAALLRNAATGRLSVQTVERLHRLLGGDVRVEEMILRFIADRYQAAALLHLPPQVGSQRDFETACRFHPCGEGAL
jgi:hypothetical protein